MVKIIFLLFINTSLLYSEKNGDLLGDWFSNIEKLETGYNFHNIYFWKTQDQKIKFQLSKISFNQYKKWEEVRYSGIVSVSNDSKVILSVESCKEYVTKKLTKRWTLFRHYDCEHIRFNIQFINENEMNITPNMNLESFIILNTNKLEVKDKVSVVIINTTKEYSWAWGHQLYRRLNKNAKANYPSNNKIELLDIIESTVKIKNDPTLKIGDLIIFNSPLGSFEP